MVQPETEIVETDVLILGGGMAGCGAAFEAAYWAKAKGLKVTIVEKAAIERSGAVAMGLSAITLYLGMRWNQNKPEDFVHYVRQDLMGLSREDLVYDIARHVDSSVHLFEEWGLPIFKNADGTYKREGRWQIMIHGESYKPIVAEAAKTAVGDGNVYERIFAARLLLDAKDPSKIAGAVGFSVRENKIYVFKAKAVIVTAGGAKGGRPREGGGPLGERQADPHAAPEPPDDGGLQGGGRPLLPHDRRGDAADVPGGRERSQEDPGDRSRRPGGLPRHDHVPGAHLGGRQHRPSQGPDGSGADGAVPHGLPRLGHRRVGERPR